MSGSFRSVVWAGEVFIDALDPRFPFGAFFAFSQKVERLFLAPREPPGEQAGQGWWGKAKDRKPLSTSKLFFFDGGVVRALQGRGPVDERSADFGDAFEALLFHELRAWADYRADGDLRYWRTTSGFEVDFILNEAVGIEAKTSRRISERDLRGLRALRQETGIKRLVLVSLEPRPRTVEGIEILPWKEFLSRLWADAFG